MPTKYVRIETERGVVELDKNNPYLIDNDEEHSNSNSNSILEMPLETLDKAVYLQQMKCPTQFICLCDLFFSFYYYYINFWFGVFTTVASFNGYLSTIYLKKSLMFCYVIYQYMQLFFRLINSSYLIYLATLPSNESGKNETVVVVENLPTNLAISVILFVLQINIAIFITKYYNRLPTEEERRRIHSNV